MNNKIIAGVFAVLIGSMAVKVFKTMKENKNEIIEEDVIEDEL